MAKAPEAVKTSGNGSRQRADKETVRQGRTLLQQVKTEQTIADREAEQGHVAQYKAIAKAYLFGTFFYAIGDKEQKALIRDAKEAQPVAGSISNSSKAPRFMPVAKMVWGAKASRTEDGARHRKQLSNYSKVMRWMETWVSDNKKALDNIQQDGDAMAERLATAVKDAGGIAGIVNAASDEKRTKPDRKPAALNNAVVQHLMSRAAKPMGQVDAPSMKEEGAYLAIVHTGPDGKANVVDVLPGTEVASFLNRRYLQAAKQ